jgi:hypothetical protein
MADDSSWWCERFHSGLVAFNDSGDFFDSLLRVTTLLAAQSESPPLEGIHFAFAGSWTRWRVTPRSVSRAF